MKFLYPKDNCGTENHQPEHKRQQFILTSRTFLTVYTTVTLGLRSAMRCLTEKRYGIIRSSLETHLKENHFLELIKC